MGHREDLLAGAVRCLHERGYSRTTARDIVAASGTNLASIGYYYGSKEALLNAAVFAAVREWVDRWDQRRSPMELPGDPIDQFEVVWRRVVALMRDDYELCVANFDAASQAMYVPELRAVFADGQQEARDSIATTLHGDALPLDPEQSRALGALYMTLMGGLMAQHVIDPDRAPSARDLTDALRILAGRPLPPGPTGDDATPDPAPTDVGTAHRTANPT